MRKHLSAAATLGIAACLAIPHTATAQESHYGGDLTAVMNLTFKTLDPIFGDADVTDRYVLNQIYDPLFRLDSEGELLPILATGYSYNEDGTELTVTLREGVTFHDGTPFDAAAVVANLERLKGSTGAMRTGTIDWMTSAQVTGPFEVTLTMAEPSGYALSSLASEGTLMVSPSAVEADPDGFGRNPVGTGPFQFSEWIGADTIMFERNPNYWQTTDGGDALPYLDGITVRSITNYATSMLELESGGAGLLAVVNPQDFERVSENPDLRLVEGPQTLAQQMALNVTIPPFDQKAVRQALAYAVDSETLARAIAGDAGGAYPTYVPPASWSFDETLEGYGHDPERSKELLAEAGYEDGVSFSLLVIQREPDVTAAQILQQMVREGGFEMEIKILERQAWIGEVITEGTFEASIFAGQHPRIDPHDSWARSFITEQGGNWSRHQNEALVDLIYEARDTVSREDRVALYRQVAEMALEESYILFLYSRRAFQGASQQVKGLELDNGGAWVMTRTWLEE